VLRGSERRLFSGNGGLAGQGAGRKLKHPLTSRGEGEARAAVHAERLGSELSAGAGPSLYGEKGRTSDGPRTEAPYTFEKWKDIRGASASADSRAKGEVGLFKRATRWWLEIGTVAAAYPIADQHGQHDFNPARSGNKIPQW